MCHPPSQDSNVIWNWPYKVSACLLVTQGHRATSHLYFQISGHFRRVVKFKTEDIWPSEFVLILRPCPNEIVLYLRHWPSEFVPVTKAAITVTIVSGQFRWVIVLKWDNLVRLRSYYLDKLARSNVLRLLEFKRPCENVRISISRHGELGNNVTKIFEIFFGLHMQSEWFLRRPKR